MKYDTDKNKLYKEFVKYQVLSMYTYDFIIK